MLSAELNGRPAGDKLLRQRTLSDAERRPHHAAWLKKSGTFARLLVKYQILVVGVGDHKLVDMPAFESMLFAISSTGESWW